jgi:hypothetical protein
MRVGHCVDALFDQSVNMSISERMISETCLGLSARFELDRAGYYLKF